MTNAIHNRHDVRSDGPAKKNEATEATWRVCSVGLVIHLSLFLWLWSNHPAIDRIVKDAAASTRAFAQQHLPSRPITQGDLNPTRLPALQNRYAPTWPSDNRPPELLDLVGTTIYIPFELNVRRVSTSRSIESLIPALLVTLPATAFLAIALWDRYFRGRRPPALAIALLNDALLTLGLLLPLPLVVSTFLRFYDSVGMGYPQVILSYAAVSTPTLLTLAALLLLLYPLVFLHLRWKRAARLATQSPDSPLCPKCNYERGTLDTCPECGTPRSAPSTKLSKAKRRTLVAGYTAIPLLLIAPFWISWIDIAVYHLTH